MFFLIASNYLSKKIIAYWQVLSFSHQSHMKIPTTVLSISEAILSVSETLDIAFSKYRCQIPPKGSHWVN